MKTLMRRGSPMIRESIVKDSPITNGSGAGDNRPPPSGGCAAPLAASLPGPLPRAAFSGAQAINDPARTSTLTLISMNPVYRAGFRGGASSGRTSFVRLVVLRRVDPDSDNRERPDGGARHVWCPELRVVRCHDAQSEEHTSEL